MEPARGAYVTNGDTPSGSLTVLDLPSVKVNQFRVDHHVNPVLLAALPKEAFVEVVA